MRPDFYIDGMLSGTGMRDAKAGGYVDPPALGLSALLARDVVAWQQRYEQAHFAGFPDAIVGELDADGLDLASRAQAELVGKVIGYYSNGRMTRLR